MARFKALPKKGGLVSVQRTGLGPVAVRRHRGCRASLWIPARRSAESSRTVAMARVRARIAGETAAAGDQRLRYRRPGCLSKLRRLGDPTWGRGAGQRSGGEAGKDVVVGSPASIGEMPPHVAITPGGA